MTKGAEKLEQDSVVEVGVASTLSQAKHQLSQEVRNI